MNEVHMIFALCALYSGVVVYSLWITFAGFEEVQIKDN